MKKRKLNSLQLNKKSISNLEVSATKGGYQSENGSCYWQDCPSNDPNFMSDCYCPNEGGGGNNTNNCQTQVNCGSNGPSCFNVDCEYY
ncbi:hypothetical protein H2O64_05045 [Kordia sp. YSTF-M3]|uniref:Natural product n=1 Tax=Kordia aestuariivivens TaxID=2759037 RepID=A0ABR7Q6Q4_9FLAO|nr:hypothetical protein [Kordia aestuariivivens]MBC8754026.1 hypothetical protein [Kordia aestuariivivens]